MRIGLFCRSLFIFEVSFVSIRVDGVAGRRHCRHHNTTQTWWCGSNDDPLIRDSGFAVMLQCVAACCSVLQCVAVCCSVLQCVAVWLDRDYDNESVIINTSTNNLQRYNDCECMTRAKSTLQHTATHCNTQQHTATHCNAAPGSWAPQLHSGYTVTTTRICYHQHIYCKSTLI